ncbi:hypothetical protein [Rosistilla oblonga]|uniref:hypothetical protein n=1 Tax=Rosistilla oblonga TaxID=2527990 RepID=UPI0011AA7459|nr:hypothetical protein [Rosistilla oblonga]
MAAVLELLINRRDRLIAGVRRPKPIVHTPIVHAEITFLREHEGGRKFLPIMGIEAKYRPHLVIQDRTVRKSVIESDGLIRESYLGVQFNNEIKEFESVSGEWTRRYELSLMYHSRVDYSAVLPRATFTVREGGKIVGHGIVLKRFQPDTEKDGEPGDARESPS